MSQKSGSRLRGRLRRLGATIVGLVGLLVLAGFIVVGPDPIPDRNEVGAAHVPHEEYLRIPSQSTDRPVRVANTRTAVGDSSAASSTVRVVVRDSGGAVEGVRVVASPLLRKLTERPRISFESRIRGVTDAAGGVVLSLPPGPYAVCALASSGAEASKQLFVGVKGFQEAVTLQLSPTRLVTVTMEPLGSQVEKLVISGPDATLFREIACRGTSIEISLPPVTRTVIGINSSGCVVGLSRQVQGAPRLRLRCAPGVSHRQTHGRNALVELVGREPQVSFLFNQAFRISQGVVCNETPSASTTA